VSVAAPLLHVTNGDSAAGTLRETGLGGEVLAWRDALHDGPVPGGTRPELLRARAGFLAACGWGREADLLAELERRDGQLTAALRDGVRVVLWFEHDLYDQLQLLDVLSLAREAGARPELIVVGSFPGRPSFRGLGELTADELETLWPDRRAAGPAELEAAAAAWDDFRAREPTALAARAREDGAELPFLAPALLRALEELPAVGDGLSGTERRALEAIASGAATPTAAFVAAQDLEDAPFLGDAGFDRVLDGLATGPAPLVQAREGELRLTDAGRSVLAGDADRVDLLGVDRWLGGTHVTPENTWRWDAGAGAVVRDGRSRKT
jgi:hypothetical protein